MKMKTMALAAFVGALGACTSAPESHQVQVSNKLDFDRKELVTIPTSDLQKLFNGKAMENLVVYDAASSSYLQSQLVDVDQDGTPDEFLFQATVAANGTASYELQYRDNASEFKPVSEVKTFSRFVPERTDDYTWENDRVAFRTYGPVAEQMVRDGEPGGTLSSGIDLWLKRVDYSIIDKWYAGYQDDHMFYHSDRGEGYDPYHVGKSRGTGGSGIWENDSLHISNNFTAYRTICTGPLRTIFELDYPSWDGYEMTETKRITLDLGSNFSRFDNSFSGNIPDDSYTIGITLHEGAGTTAIDKEAGIFSHWEPIDGDYVGEGLIVAPEMLADAFVTNSEVPDQNQLLVITQANGHLTYYAGFAWTRSKQVENETDWQVMLKQQAAIVANPLELEIK